MIEQPELDTVLIRRDLRMTMEAIMTRDQRTTSHRVLERGTQGNGNNAVSSSSSSLYQKIIKATTNKNKSLTTKKNVDTTRTLIGTPTVATIMTTLTSMTTTTSATSTLSMPTSMMTTIKSPTRVDDFTELTKTRKNKTENQDKFFWCDTRRDICNFRNDVRRIEGNVYKNNSKCNSSKYNNGRGLMSFQHKNPSTTWLRLGSLLVALLVVSVQGAPTTMTLEDRRLSSPPKWVNPCGLAAEDFDGDLDVVQLRDEQLLTQVVVQAKTALDHAQLFRDDYIKRTFNTDFADLHSTWKDNHYDWLPGPKEIPKQLGEHLAQEYLDKLEVRLLDTALLDAYEYMQRYAVGLEQIVWDQEDHRLEFREQFKDTEFKLRTVLCELQVALVERGVTPRPDVTRDAMSSEYRAMSASATYRNLRDWLIFRDYMNGLEYVVQVFEHLRRGLES